MCASARPSSGRVRPLVIGGAVLDKPRQTIRTFTPLAADRRSRGRLHAGLPPAASRRGQRAGAAARCDRRQVRAQRLHPHRRDRQGHAGDAAGRDGPGRLYGDSDDPRRRTRRRYRAGRAAARAAERQAVRQSDLRPAGDRQFKLDPRLLEAAAERRRQRARHAGAGRRQAMAGRRGGLHGVEGRGHAHGERPKALLRRAGDRREQRGATEGCRR